MSENKRSSLLAIALFLLIVTITIFIIQLVGVGIDLLRVKLNLPVNEASQIVENESPVVQENPLEGSDNEFPDFTYYQGLSKRLVLASSTTSWVSRPDDPDSVKGRVYKTFIRSDGGIANAYLFVDVSVDDGKPLTVWDSIYVSLRKVIKGYPYQPSNGHLHRGVSLDVPQLKGTKLLYDLRRIPLTTLPYSNNNSYQLSDWLKVLNDANEFQFETFLSTLRKGGVINEIVIAYECKDDNPGCKLELIK